MLTSTPIGLVNLSAVRILLAEPEHTDKARQHTANCIWSCWQQYSELPTVQVAAFAAAYLKYRRSSGKCPQTSADRKDKVGPTVQPGHT